MKWHSPFPAFAFYKVRLLSLSAYGDGRWTVSDDMKCIESGNESTMDEAKSAAIASARSILEKDLEALR